MRNSLGRAVVQMRYSFPTTGVVFFILQDPQYEKLCPKHKGQSGFIVDSPKSIGKPG